MAREHSLLTLLLEDHRELEHRLQTFAGSPISGRGERFRELAESILRHEIAEELVLYPVIAMEPGGAAVAHARLSEQSLALETLDRLQKLDAKTAAFAELFEDLRSAIVEHARSKEEFVFPMVNDESAVLEETGRLYRNRRELPAAKGLPLAELAAVLRKSPPEITRRKVRVNRSRSPGTPATRR